MRKGGRGAGQIDARCRIVSPPSPCHLSLRAFAPSRFSVLLSQAVGRVKRRPIKADGTRRVPATARTALGECLLPRGRHSASACYGPPGSSENGASTPGKQFDLSAGQRVVAGGARAALFSNDFARACRRGGAARGEGPSNRGFPGLGAPARRLALGHLRRECISTRQHIRALAPKVVAPKKACSPPEKRRPAPASYGGPFWNNSSQPSVRASPIVLPRRHSSGVLPQ